MKSIFNSSLILLFCLNVMGQHVHLKHFKPHGHEEHLHFKSSINHCKAMAAYGKHTSHYRHVPHVTEVVHNVPLPRTNNPQSVAEPTLQAQKAEPIAEPQTEPAKAIEPEEEKPVNKTKSNPKIARYSAKIDSLQPGESFNLPAITFISNQDALAVTNMDSFLEAAEFAKNGYIILIEGHTDDRGDDDYNMKLSMKRVAKIKQLMIEQGVPEDNISVVGNGEKMPLVPNTSDENRLQNRRIEFKIFKMQ
jgi:outer membrane protein OmpA-like peptidoglycan-associated protein